MSLGKMFTHILFLIFGLWSCKAFDGANDLGPDGTGGPRASFRGFSLLAATPQTPNQVKVMQDLSLNTDDGIVDFWSEPKQLGRPVDVLVHPQVLDKVEALFDREKVDYHVRTTNFQDLIDAEKESIRKSESQLSHRDPLGRYPLNFSSYNTFDEIDNYLNHVFQNPLKYTLRNVKIGLESQGTTHEGRPINMMSLALNDGKQRPAIFLDCGIHAREWVSPAFCLHSIRTLLSTGEFGKLSEFDFHIIPVANPDGYVYTHEANRMWRKNRAPSRTPRQFWSQPGNNIWTGFGPPAFGGQFGSHFSSQQSGNPSLSPSRCQGTDPNRNFDIAHGTVGSSDQPCKDTFHGVNPFSEAESRAIRDAILKIQAKQTIASYVSVHAYSQMWMTPNGYDKSLTKDHQDLMRVARQAVNALTSVHGTQYQYGPIAKIIYEAAGSSCDWAYTKANIKYSYALELRDEGQYGFMLPTSQIQPTVEETWAGLEAMADAIVKEFY